MFKVQFSTPNLPWQDVAAYGKEADARRCAKANAAASKEQRKIYRVINDDDGSVMQTIKEW